MREYDAIADRYVATRRPEIGVAEVDTLTATLGPRARVLDIGCGDGIPITRRLVEAGCDAHAVDSSPVMVSRFRANLPDVPVECSRIQDSALLDLPYEAVVAWGVLFHLTAADQAETIVRVGRALRPGGRVLFTAGEAEGVTRGSMHGVDFSYVSIGAARYAALLETSGLRLCGHHRDRWDNVYYDAEKRP